MFKEELVKYQYIFRTLSLEDTFFENPKRGGGVTKLTPLPPTPPPSHFRVKASADSLFLKKEVSLFFTLSRGILYLV